MSGEWGQIVVLDTSKGPSHQNMAPLHFNPCRWWASLPHDQIALGTTAPMKRGLKRLDRNKHFEYNSLLGTTAPMKRGLKQYLKYML